MQYADMKRHAFIFLPLSFCLGIASAGAVAAPSAFPSDETIRNRMLNEARDKAAVLENDGLLRDAVEQWWIIDALSPSDSDGQRNIDRLQSRIQSLASESFSRGLKAQKQGKTAQSQQAFITVLQLVPGHSDALRALKEIETGIMLKELRKKGAEGPAAPAGPVS
jgi:hypothetical protein